MISAPNRACADGRLREHRQFRPPISSLYVDERRDQRPAPESSARQQRRRGRSSSRWLVVVGDAGDAQQLVDHLLVDVGVLAQVEPAQVGPEDADRPAARGIDRAAASARRRRASASEAAHDVEVGDQLVGRGVRRQRRRGAAGRAPRRAPRRRRLHSRACMPRRARRYGSSARNGESSADASASTASAGVGVISRADIDSCRDSACSAVRWCSSAVVACDVDRQAAARRR